MFTPLECAFPQVRASRVCKWPRMFQRGVQTVKFEAERTPTNGYPNYRLDSTSAQHLVTVICILCLIRMLHYGVLMSRMDMDKDGIA